MTGCKLSAVLALSLPAVVVLGGAARVSADSRISFSRIVDSETPAPGGLGTFNSFQPPVNVDGTIGFWGQSTTSEPGRFDEGIYVYRDGQVQLVANQSTPMTGAPPQVGNFVQFTPPSLGAGGGAFSGFGANNWQGIYSFDEELALSVVADRNTPDPAGPSNLAHFFLCSRNGADVAFSAFPFFDPRFAWNHGIYSTAPGALSLVASYTTPIPGGTGNFTAFEFNVTIGDRVVAFTGYGAGDQAGVYTNPNGLTVVADTQTLIPGGTGTFTSFADRPSSHGGAVAFHGAQIERQAYRVVQEGIYTDAGGDLRVVADLHTAIPGGLGTFARFGTSSFGSHYGAVLADGRIVFRGEGENGQRGIYCEQNGELIKVVDLNTALEPGKTLTNVFVEQQCLDGNRLAFLAEFSNEPGQFFRAIYVATLGLAGDLNCDGDINALDIEPFIVALFEPAGYPDRYPDCDINLADVNGDDEINAFDIEPFLDLLFP